MLQVAAAFGGGLAIKQAFDGVQLPQLKKAGADGSAAFTLSVRVLAASVPGLAAPGLLSHQRPYLEGSLGSSKKETEFADFSPNAGGPYAEECPWRFGDTLTFKARLEDVVGPGLKLSLRVRKDIVLGPVQFEMKAAQVGEGALDLQQRVLPACVQERRDAARGGGQWASPVLLVPLAHVPEGVCGGDCRLGEAVAHVAVVFSVDVDPEPILAALKPTSLTQRVEDGVGGAMGWIGARVAAVEKQQQESVDGVMRWLAKPSRLGIGNVAGGAPYQGGLPPAEVLHSTPRPAGAAAAGAIVGAPPPTAAAAAAAAARFFGGYPAAAAATPRLCVAGGGGGGSDGGGGTASGARSVPTPARGAPPWGGGGNPGGYGGGGGGGGGYREPPAAGTGRGGGGGGGGCGAAPRESSVLWGPDLSPEGWVCQRQPNGRTFWHHRALGPAPWEVGGGQGARPLPSSLALPVPPQRHHQLPSQRLGGCRGAAVGAASAAELLPRRGGGGAGGGGGATPIQRMSRSRALSETEECEYGL